MYEMQSWGTNNRPSLRNALQATTIAVMLVGTGSVYSMERSDTWRSHLQHRVPFDLTEAVRSDNNQHIDVRTPLEHLANIRAVLNPAVSDLASTFDVSRQAIYKWLSGESNPEHEKLMRIQALSRIADAFNEAGIARAGSLLKLKTFAGRSLLDIVKAGDHWQNAVNTLITESQAMEAAYERSGLSRSKAQPTSDWLATHSIPASREEV